MEKFITATNGPTSTFLVAMFRAIDERRFHELDRFFHQSIVYARPGFPTVEGFSALLQFYVERRPIASGRHTVEKLIADCDSAVALGRFQGSLKDGNAVDESFADAYAFRDGLIAVRKTFFFRPAI